MKTKRLMLDSFKSFLESSGVGFSSKILLAVSGGVDSMVLLHLSSRLNLNISIAHVNYNLRETESEKDEQLVRETAEKMGIPLFVNSFDTKVLVEESKDSLQTVARNLRYQWFNNLMNEHNFDFLFTGHHLNDSIETFFINLNRGTGIKGLLGINNNNRIIRPLKEIPRYRIQEYASKNQVNFREDKSNSDTKYLRNWLRHDIINKWQERNPSFLDSMKKTMLHLDEINTLVENLIKQDVQLLNGDFQDNIPIDRIRDFKLPKQSLEYLLRPYGFSYLQIEDILGNVSDGEHGQEYISSTHRLIVDREDLTINAIETKNEIEEIIIKDYSDFNKRFETIELSLSESIPSLNEMGTNEQYLDLASLQYPLRFRKWKSGDRIRPLGMNGTKKISDILTDKKISILEKEKTLVLESDGSIAAIIGLLIGEEYKIDSQTKRVLKIECKS